MLESKFQKELKRKILNKFKGAIVLKTDPTSYRGIPDLLVLFGKKWVFLECKKCKTASKRPLQQRWIDTYENAYFVYPENEEVILNELETTLRD